MKSKKLDSGTLFIFDTGDEVISTLTAFAKKNHIASHFTASAHSATSVLDISTCRKMNASRIRSMNRLKSSP